MSFLGLHLFYSWPLYFSLSMVRVFHVRGNAGLGVFLERQGGSQWFTHGGSNMGYKCFSRYAPEAGIGTVVMVNSDDIGFVNKVQSTILTLLQDLSR